jgi:hypothetical protein
VCRERATLQTWSAARRHIKCQATLLPRTAALSLAGVPGGWANREDK